MYLYHQDIHIILTLSMISPFINVIEIRSLTCSPLLIYNGVGDLRKTHNGYGVGDMRKTHNGSHTIAPLNKIGNCEIMNKHFAKLFIKHGHVLNPEL